jgi:hypothetical protein
MWSETCSWTDLTEGSLMLMKIVTRKGVSGRHLWPCLKRVQLNDRPQSWIRIVGWKTASFA